ncbi:hypothetical protein [Comamonas thiooxydans]|uniref:Uncharacterized protein n=1 Tax=Comamonas thiooxydans TaxID=363952 RepID=A0A0E3B9T6_9BURK|nr:hypothetical protein [Comamonas thiooxydans]KGG83784.1 hypothetical protein P245_24700 [Comamonas thiooxydans]KGH23560.1 hypothetical protein P606_11625 [Comamonas thiooxydans]
MLRKIFKRKPAPDLIFLLERLGGGAQKRVDENRELLELLLAKAPGLLEAEPWIVGWLRCNDEVFTEMAAMASRLNLHTYADPRPWPEIPPYLATWAGSGCVDVPIHLRLRLGDLMQQLSEQLRIFEHLRRCREVQLSNAPNVVATKTGKTVE